MTPDTLPRLLLRNSLSMPARPAFRHRHRGIWETLSWAEFAALVSEFAFGLIAHSAERQARVAVLGDNRPRLYAALLAGQALGGIGIVLDPEAGPTELVAMVRDSGATAIVVQDHEHTEMLRAARSQIPQSLLLIKETPGTGAGDESDPLTFEAIAAAGREYARQHASAVETMIAAGRPEDPALLLLPREDSGHGITLLHRDLLAGASSIAAAEDVRPSDNAFCYLPMCTIGDAIYSLALGLLVGFACNCPESPGTVMRDLREIAPDVLLAPPTVWHRLARIIEERIAAASPLKRRTCQWFRGIALRAEQYRETGSAVPLPLRLADGLGEALIKRPIRDQLGLSRLRWAHPGTEPMDAELAREFRALGVELRSDRLGPAVSYAMQPNEPAHA